MLQWNQIMHDALKLSPIDADQSLSTHQPQLLMSTRDARSDDASPTQWALPTCSHDPI